MKQKFALELYSVRHDLAQDFEGTLKAVRDMGYIGVEFAGGFVHSADRVSAALKDLGLVCCGWHTPWDYVQDDRLEATIAYNKAVGNRFIIVPGLPGECTATVEAWKATAAKFNEITAKLAGHGLFLGYHNHWDEFKAVDGQTPFDAFFGTTNPEIIVQLDNGNALAGGADMLDIIKRYPGRLRTVHLKAYSLTDGFDTMIGEDSVPWTDFMRLCDEVGKAEWYIVEYESEKLHTPLTGVKLCIEALKKMQDEGKI